jgi:methylated-DNA-protein-cysteine methyltransferase-like protein
MVGSPRTGRAPGSSTLARLRFVIARVPRGRVITYGQAAKFAGSPGAARLTVRALYGAQGLPSHRVVAAGGRIALTGEDRREQRLRLAMEGVTFRGGRVRMDLHGWAPRARKVQPDGPTRKRARVVGPGSLPAAADHSLARRSRSRPERTSST